VTSQDPPGPDSPGRDGDPQRSGPQDTARAADADEPIVLEELVEGGEPSCYAHMVCVDCGAVDSEAHLPGCPSAPTDA
jgi:hypothetical protein